MSKIKDFLIEQEEKKWEFAEKEHEEGQHQTFQENCPACNIQ